MADVDDVIVPGIVHWQHPSFFAYFPSNTSYPSILGELLSAGLGVQGMSWVTSPACTELESLMLDWMVELLDLPDRFRNDSAAGGGVIHGSASEATLVAILAARWRATGGAVNADGDTSRLVAYATAQAHSSVEKGLRIAGIGTDRLRTVAHDERFAMRPDALGGGDRRRPGRRAGAVLRLRHPRHDVVDGLRPDAADRRRLPPTPASGCTSTRRCAASPRWRRSCRWVNAGLDGADSYCTNPHKWMGVNFDCDLFWTADRAALLGALSILPEYLRSAAAERGAAIDYRDWQIPLGRRFRALKLWMTLRARRRRGDPGDDPPPRRADPAAGRRGRRGRPLRDRRPAPAQPAVRPRSSPATRRPTR